jgi:hypothetical protein
LTSFQSFGSSSRISLRRQPFSVSPPRLRPPGNIHNRSRLLLTNKIRPRFVAISFDDFAIAVPYPPLRFLQNAFAEQLLEQEKRVALAPEIASIPHAFSHTASSLRTAAAEFETLSRTFCKHHPPFCTSIRPSQIPHALNRLFCWGKLRGDALASLRRGVCPSHGLAMLTRSAAETSSAKVRAFIFCMTLCR